eukprot:935388-Pyramimonas_sp.AAC.1
MSGGSGVVAVGGLQQQGADPVATTYHAGRLRYALRGLGGCPWGGSFFRAPCIRMGLVWDLSCPQGHLQ